jgi:hypothetical protein
LQFVSGLGSVVPTLGEPPRDVILYVVIEVEILYKAPKFHELRKVLNRKVIPQVNFMYPSIVL